MVAFGLFWFFGQSNWMNWINLKIMSQEELYKWVQLETFSFLWSKIWFLQSYKPGEVPEKHTWSRKSVRWQRIGWVPPDNHQQRFNLNGGRIVSGQNRLDDCNLRHKSSECLNYQLFNFAKVNFVFYDFLGASRAGQLWTRQGIHCSKHRDDEALQSKVPGYGRFDGLSDSQSNHL